MRALSLLGASLGGAQDILSMVTSGIDAWMGRGLQNTKLCIQAAWALGVSVIDHILVSTRSHPDL